MVLVAATPLILIGNAVWPLLKLGELDDDVPYAWIIVGGEPAPLVFVPLDVLRAGAHHDLGPTGRATALAPVMAVTGVAVVAFGLAAEPLLRLADRATML